VVSRALRIGHWNFSVTHAPAGDGEIPLDTKWSDLPVEMKELILNHLSWIDLARISSTCSTFHTAFRRQLAREQKRRCDLAFLCFGRGQIYRIADFIERYLEGKSLDASNPDEPNRTSSSILADGTVVGPPQMHLFPRAYKSTNASVKVGLTKMNIKMTAPSGSLISIFTCKESGESIARVYPIGNEDIAGVAFLQALLCEGLAPLSSGAGPHLEICVMRDVSDANITQAGLRMQIAPLLPFGSLYRSRYRQVNLSTRIGENMKVCYR
jgi:hypothetical protein